MKPIRTNRRILSQNLRSHAWPKLAALATVSQATGTFAQSIESFTQHAELPSGRLILHGSDLGEQPGRVVIGGHDAHLAAWTNERIACYLPEGAQAGRAAVSVTTADGRTTEIGPISIESTPVNPRGPTRVRWRFDADGLRFATRPVVSPDGLILAITTSGTLHAIRPDGSIKWTRPGVNGAKSAAVGADGTVYVTGLGVMLAALDPDDGNTVWTLPFPTNAGPVFSGPSVGPDGTIYIATDENLSAGLDFGVAAINPDATIKWNTSNNFGVRVGSFGYAWELTPGSEGVYFNSGMGNPLDNVTGVFALDPDDGSVMWSINARMWPQLGMDGNIYQRNLDGNFFASYGSDGSLRWSSHHSNYAGTPTGEIDLDPDSNFYTTSGINFASGDSDGNFRWNIRRTSATMQYAAASPTAGLVVNQVIDFDANVSPSIRGYDTTDGRELWSQDLGFDQGIRITQSWVGSFASDGATYYVPASGNNSASDPIAPLFAIATTEPTDCPPDLAAPFGVLNIFDIQAFIQLYNAQDPAADLAAPFGTFNIFDIQQYINLYNQGCP